MNVLIIDDDKLVCSSLKIILNTDGDINVCGIGHNGREAVELYQQLKPDVLLMDIRMDVMTGLEAGELILSRDPNAKILYLTTFLEDEYIIKALNMGAKGYMLKQDFECIVPSIKAVYMGQNVFGSEIVTKLPVLMHQKSIDMRMEEYGITEKEFMLVQDIAEGLSNKEIAEHLFLSEGTIRNYISVILEKLNLRDRTQIAVFYYKNK